MRKSITIQLNLHGFILKSRWDLLNRLLYIIAFLSRDSVKKQYRNGHKARTQLGHKARTQLGHKARTQLYSEKQLKDIIFFLTF